MKYPVALIAFLLLMGSAQAQDEVIFAYKKVSFVPPKAFSRMTEDIVAKKYPRGNALEYVFSNESTTVSMAAGYTPNANLTLEQLPQFREFMEKVLELSSTRYK